jgi:hypothetical protein
MRTWKRRQCVRLALLGIFFWLVVQFFLLLCFIQLEFSNVDNNNNVNLILNLPIDTQNVSANKIFFGLNHAATAVAVSATTTATTVGNTRPVSTEESSFQHYSEQRRVFNNNTNNTNSSNRWVPTTTFPKEASSVTNVSRGINPTSAGPTTTTTKIPTQNTRPQTAPFNTETGRNSASPRTGDYILVIQLYENWTRPLRIRVLLFLNQQGPDINFRPGPTARISDEILNIGMDGFERSRSFELVNATVIPDNPTTFVLPEDEDIVWVVDLRRMKTNLNYSIPEQLVHLVRNTLDYQRARFGNGNGNGDSATTTTTTTTQPRLKVVFMDYRDKVDSLCDRDQGRAVQQVMDLLLGGPATVRLVAQPLVIKRKWSDSQGFPQPGRLAITNLQKCFAYPVLHVPYTVRSEYAQAVQEQFRRYLPPNNQRHSNTVNATPCDTVRPRDVAHFWRIDHTEPHAKLRNAVTQTLKSLNGIMGHVQQQDTNATTSSIRNMMTVLADVVSAKGAMGRTKAQAAYTKALLRTKIVVVAQRDSWEDHYRLMEALIGGALVLTDPMKRINEYRNKNHQAG